MFRRIEIIYGQGQDIDVWWNNETWPSRSKARWVKRGLDSCGIALNALGLKAPEIRTHKTVRFYFTEKGWKSIGCRILHLVKELKWQHRLITVKENSVDVVYCDINQVAIRPRKMRHKNERTNS